MSIRHIFRYLTDDGLVGDGTNHIMVVNGGTTPVPFYAGPAAGKRWDIARMIVYVEDLTATSSQYGGISALTNGTTVKTTTSGHTGPTTLDLLDGAAIKKNGDWSGLCYDLTLDTAGQGNSVVRVRWTFTAAGAPITLIGHKQDKFVVTINDALAGLVEHHIMIQGIEYEA